MLKAGASVEVAKAAWTATKKAMADNGNNPAPVPHTGNPSIPEARADSAVRHDDECFMALVDRRCADTGCSRPEAVAFCRRNYPEAYAEQFGEV